MNEPSLHRHVSRVLHADAPPAVVFPLLCPVREHDWVDGWSADVLHSVSGFAELGCVFVAHRGEVGEATFVVTRYEPAERIEFSIFDGATAETLAIALAPARGGTDMTWTRRYTALTPAGAAAIEADVPGHALERLGRLEAMMNKYLARK